MSVVRPAPSKTIDSQGVVIVADVNALPPTRPGPDKGAVGIKSWAAVVFGDTTGPITQFKIDEWVPGDTENRGSFARHGHGGEQPMGELFFVLSGTAAFCYNVPGGPVQTVIIGAEGLIYFPPGVMHAGWNEGPVTTRLLVLGVREATHPCDVDRKGLNIPVFT